MSRIQATCRCKKLCCQRAIENAFSKVLLIVLGNGKTMVEIDTTKPEFRCESIPENQLIQVQCLSFKKQTSLVWYYAKFSLQNLGAVTPKYFRRLL